MCSMLLVDEPLGSPRRPGRPPSRASGAVRRPEPGCSGSSLRGSRAGAGSDSDRGSGSGMVAVCQHHVHCSSVDQCCYFWYWKQDNSLTPLLSP